MLRAVSKNTGVTVAGFSGVVSSVTGTISETALATITIPAGAMGPNGRIEIEAVFSYTNSANAKTMRIHFGGIAGTNILGLTATTTAVTPVRGSVTNRNSASSQIMGGSNNVLGYAAGTNAINTSTVDTTAAVDIVISGQLGSAGETISLENYRVFLFYGA